MILWHSFTNSTAHKLLGPDQTSGNSDCYVGDNVAIQILNIYVLSQNFPKLLLLRLISSISHV